MVSVMWPEHEFRMVVDALELVVDGLEREKAENAKLRALVKDIDKRLADEIERLNTCLPLIEAAYKKSQAENAKLRAALGPITDAYERDLTLSKNVTEQEWLWVSNARDALALSTGKLESE